MQSGEVAQGAISSGVVGRERLIEGLDAADLEDAKLLPEQLKA